MERNKVNKIAKKMVTEIIWMFTGFGGVALIIQVMTLNMGVNNWLSTWCIPMQGNDHQIYYIQTLIMILLWMFISYYNGMPEDEWKGILTLIALFMIFAILMIFQVSNLEATVQMLENAITIEQCNTIRWSIGIAMICSVATALAKIFYVKVLQTYVDDSYLGPGYKKLP